MEDPEVVASILAGDPAGLEEAYDKYAVPLYSYCRSTLREPARAADAVQDTFLVATATLRQLRDRNKFRPWLYAVARNECLRRLRATRLTSGLEEATEQRAQPVELSAAAGRAELQALARDAVDGLNPGERDVILLSLGHDLQPDELAGALGVSRNHAHALLSRARSQLERSLGPLVVARAGRDACAELDAILAGWDGQVTVLLRKRTGRHIERCEICGDRKRRELTPALFAGMAPLAALAPGFRSQLLHILADRTPGGVAHRLSVANRAGPFGPSGFPRPVSIPAAAPGHRVLYHPQAFGRHSHTVVAAAATAVAAAGAVAVVFIGGAHHGRSAEPAGGAAHAAAGDSSASSAHGGPGPSDPVATASPAAYRPGPTGGTGKGPGGGTTAARSSSPASASPSRPPASPSGSAATSPAPSSSSSAPAQGTLTTSTGTLDLVTVNGTATGTFTLTAKGGPAGYSVTAGSALAGRLAVSPASGSLAAGASVTITVTSTSLVALDGPLTVNPGGHTITVVLSVGL